jgi:dihydroxy-acid dehydratase
MKPTTMLFRNLMAMDVEECIRAYPLDAVVLLSGCDKTTPAMLMGAASADVPAIMVTGGPMLRGRWRTEDLGSGTDLWRLAAEQRAGRITDEEMSEAESCMSRSAGHCMVMGTASTMASMAEALGMTLPGNAAIPAPDATVASTIRRCRSTRPPCSCSSTSAPGAPRGCRNGARRRSPPACSGAACGTWCGSPTPG